MESMETGRVPLISRRVAQQAETVVKQQAQANSDRPKDDRVSIQGLMPEQKPNAIIGDPREYQIELFERAKKQNIIAVLDTGL